MVRKLPGMILFCWPSQGISVLVIVSGEAVEERTVLAVETICGYK